MQYPPPTAVRRHPCDGHLLPISALLIGYLPLTDRICRR
jgi:hypothetical protein